MLPQLPCYYKYEREGKNMESVVKSLSVVKTAGTHPTREQAENAVRTLLAYVGEDPNREGLLDTPKRMVKTWETLFGGYNKDPAKELNTVFEEVGGYKDIVLVRDVPFFSHCEHHIVPITGKAHIAYYPKNGVVGLSKLARCRLT